MYAQSKSDCAVIAEARTYTVLDNIAEWKKCCSVAGPAMIPCDADWEEWQKHPGNCVDCTESLIRAIERSLSKSWWRRLIAKVL
jgi:hypothetical protein